MRRGITNRAGFVHRPVRGFCLTNNSGFVDRLQSIEVQEGVKLHGIWAGCTIVHALDVVAFY